MIATWRTSSPVSVQPIPPERGPARAPATDLLVVEAISGRLRWWRHFGVAALGAAAGWLWFGSAGLVPLAIWAWQRRPLPGTVRRMAIGGIETVRLGAWRAHATGSRGERFEIFRDEVPAAQWAALRRQLKRRASAGDRPQHVEPV